MYTYMYMYMYIHSVTPQKFTFVHVHVVQSTLQSHVYMYMYLPSSTCTCTYTVLHHSNNTLVYNYIVPINSDRTCPSYKSSTTSLTMIRRSSRTSFIHFKMAYGKRYKTLLLNISVYQQQSP